MGWQDDKKQVMEQVWVVDNTNVLIADLTFATLILIVWLIWLKNDYISLGMILVYVSMIPIWHYYSGTFAGLV